MSDIPEIVRAGRGNVGETPVAAKKTNKRQTGSRGSAAGKKDGSKTTGAARQKATKPAGASAEQQKSGQSQGHAQQDFTNLAAVEPFVVKDPEAMARNMAHVIEELGRAASAWVKPRETGEKKDTISGPGTDMVKTFSKLSEYWLSDPRRAVEAQTHLLTSYFDIWSNSIRKLSGEDTADVAAEHMGDRRFTDEDWQNNAFFSFLRQAYWVTTDWADKLVKDADGLDPHTRHKAEFYVKQITSAK